MIKILKGVLVGLGAILPGLSGGMLAASMHIYNDLIEALDAFTKKPLHAIFKIWHYLLGIVLGVLLGFLLIAFIYTHIPIPTTFIFIGVILSTVPSYYKEIDFKTLKFKHYLIMMITIALMISTLFLKASSASLQTNYLIMIVVGILLALSLIIPGLSGTMILMALGFYKPLVDMFKMILDALVTFDLEIISPHIPMILVLGLSGLMSLILLAKFVSHLIKNHARLFNLSIFAIIIVSPFTILYSLHLEDNNLLLNTHWLIYVLSMLLLIVSCYLTYYFSKEKNDDDAIKIN